MVEKASVLGFTVWHLTSKIMKVNKGKHGAALEHTKHS